MCIRDSGLAVLVLVGLLAFSQLTLSSPPTASELGALGLGMLALLLVNAAILGTSLTPLVRLRDGLRDVDGSGKGTRVPEQGPEAVSYTHLDVYKRQGQLAEREQPDEDQDGETVGQEDAPEERHTGTLRGPGTRAAERTIHVRDAPTACSGIVQQWPDPRRTIGRRPPTLSLIHISGPWPGTRE